MRVYDPERFRELLLYISDRMVEAGHNGQGRTKVANLLWLSDFEAYRLLGDSITGARYRSGELGASPPDHLIEATQPVRAAVFHSRELALVDEIVDRYRDWTSNQLVERVAHQHPAHKLVQLGEELPYESVFICPEPPPTAAVELGRQLIRDGTWESTLT